MSTQSERLAAFPADSAAAITPSDVNDLENHTRGLYIGGAGDVKVIMANGTEAVTFTALAVGVVHPLRVRRVYDTDTTATAIVGVW